MPVTASVTTAVVLTVVAFLHGAGREPQAHSWVVGSIAECQTRATEIGDHLRKDPRVRSWKAACLVAQREDTP